MRVMKEGIEGMEEVVAGLGEVLDWGMSMVGELDDEGGRRVHGELVRVVMGCREWWEEKLREARGDAVGKVIRVDFGGFGRN